MQRHQQKSDNLQPNVDLTMDSFTTTSFDVDIVPLQNIVYFFIHQKQPPRPINEISVQERERSMCSTHRGLLENSCLFDEQMNPPGKFMSVRGTNGPSGKIIKKLLLEKKNKYF